MFKLTQKKGLHRLFGVGIAVLIIIWAGFNIINFVQYHQFYNFARRDLGENLALLARILASSIPSDWVELSKADMAELAKNDPTNFIELIVDGEKIYSIAVLDTNGNVIFSTDSQIENGKENPYWASEIKTIHTAGLGIPIYGGLRKVGKRYLRVAFAPITDEFGKIVGIVGIEAGANYFGLLATLESGLWISGIVSAFAILFIVIILWFGKRELEKLYSQLEQAATLSGIGMMAATLAHEIRNPLAIIKGSAEAIPDSSDDDVGELVQFINEEVDRLSGIVESHLAVARGREFPKMPAKLSAVIDKVIPRYRDRLGQRGIGVIVEVEDDPIVPYSFSSIRQVLYNIMENATSAISQGGIIRIKISQDRSDGKDFGVISISDNGKGIPKEQLKHIFTPLHTTKKEGTGLGLFIAKKIVDGHNGNILVESSEGEGTTFKILIPKYSE
ncbi:hypothetical protein DRQ29_06075 [bacterium]|nr:MAG: hypothetical protein DRQ29_06075 [bacterium]